MLPNKPPRPVPTPSIISPILPKPPGSITVPDLVTCGVNIPARMLDPIPPSRLARACSANNLASIPENAV